MHRLFILLIGVLILFCSIGQAAEKPGKESETTERELDKDIKETLWATVGGAAIGGILGLSTLSFYPDWKKRTSHIGNGGFVGGILAGSAGIFSKIFGFVEPPINLDDLEEQGHRGLPWQPIAVSADGFLVTWEIRF